jgi:urea transporter
MTKDCKVPIWGQVLRGFSQCAFQANEITGILFVIAVVVFDLVHVGNGRMASFYVLGVIVGTLVARVLNGIGELLDLGLYGFNSGLMGIALGSFFKEDALLWLWVFVFAIVAAAVTVAWSKWVPVPFLAAPFILTFWAMWPLADTLELTKIDFGPFQDMEVDWGKSILMALGSALFVPFWISAVIFFVGIAISNWRHALIAAFGAFLANALAERAGAHGGAINLGFVGFNGVLAAVAVYVIVAADLRLVVLASLLATWLASYVIRGFPAPVLASGFVLAIWAILFLGWLNPRFAAKPSEPKTASEEQPKKPADAKGQLQEV